MKIQTIATLIAASIITLIPHQAKANDFKTEGCGMLRQALNIHVMQTLELPLSLDENQDKILQLASAKIAEGCAQDDVIADENLQDFSDMLTDYIKLCQLNQRLIENY